MPGCGKSTIGKKLAEATGKIVKWTSSDATVASVNADTGVVTGVKAGTAVITATVDGTEISDTITVTVIAATGSLSKPAYSNPMDEVNAEDNLYPLDWSVASKAQKALASQIVAEADGRQYYQMKRSGGEGNANSWAVVYPVANYASVVLKYDIMVNNGDLTDWSVYLPAFTDGERNRAIGLTVKENVLQGTELTLTPGTWYTVELVLKGSDWVLFVNGEKV